MGSVAIRTTPMHCAIIMAVDEAGGFGLTDHRGRHLLPWERIPEDLKRFRRITVGHGRNALIMGRNTALGLRSALPGRATIVVSSEFGHAHSLEHALAIASHNRHDAAYVIGGVRLISEAMLDKRFTTAHVTEVRGKHHASVVFRKRFEDCGWIVSKETPSLDGRAIFKDYIRVDR